MIAKSTLTFKLVSKTLSRTLASSLVFNRDLCTTLTNTKWLDLKTICETARVPEKFNFARDVFDKNVETRPGSIALWFDNDNTEQKWTFSQLRKESIRASLMLQDLLSARCQDTVDTKSTPYILTLLPRVPEWWFLHLASIRIGTVFSPATTMLSTEDVQYRLEATRASIILTDERNAWKIDKAQERSLSLKELIKVAIVSKSGLGTMDVLKENGWFIYHEKTSALKQNDIISFKDSDTKSDSIAQVFFTSGTTGHPKMVAHRHSSYGIGHYKTATLIGLRETDTHWNISDPGWAKSSYSSFFAPWITGSTVYIHQMERFESKKVLEILKTRPITTFCAPPTLYREMVQEKDKSLFQFKSLRSCFGGGEAVNPEVARHWKELSGLPLSEMYGQTETTGIGGPYPSKEGSFGKPISKGGYDIRIVDETGTEYPRGTEGNIAIKVKPNFPVGLFQGPFEVESLLQTHPAVMENAVVASPDPIRGVVVKAFIVLTENYKDRNKENLIKEIQNYMKQRTAPYKYARKIEFVENLPKTVSGKILRRELRRQEFENKTP